LLTREHISTGENATRGLTYINIKAKVKVKLSHYRSGVAQRLGKSVVLHFHDRGTRRWVRG